MNKSVRWLVVVAAFVLAPVACVRAGSLQVIADTDTVMPVPGPPTTFSTFGLLNGVDPSISGENVAFGACCLGGYFARIDGELVLLANTETTFPGTDERFGVSLAFGSSASISGRNVAFGGNMGVPGPQIICAHIDGSFQIIATAGVTLVPGSTATLQSFFLGDGAGPSISGENIAFTAATNDDRNGIYAFINGSLRTIADSNTVVPGVSPPRTFTNFGQLQGVSPSISGENVAFFAQWSSGGPSPGAGVYAYINGQLRVIVDTTTPMLPEAAPFCGSFFADFGYGGGGPSISAENVAFLGGCGIFAYINGTLRVIADTDTPIPEGTETFSVFPVSPVISGENVVFGATGGELAALGGIFAYIDGSLRLIANSHTPVPGHEETNFNGFFLVGPVATEGVRPSISGENVVFSANAFTPESVVSGVYALLPEPPGPPIPTLSQWWLITLAILMLLTGATILRRRALPANG